MNAILNTFFDTVKTLRQRYEFEDDDNDCINIRNLKIETISQIDSYVLKQWEFPKNFMVICSSPSCSTFIVESITDTIKDLFSPLKNEFDLSFLNHGKVATATGNCIYVQFLLSRK